MRIKKILAMLLLTASASAQTATINWTAQDQIIDGFGASDAFSSASMSSADQNFFFGSGPGQLSLSILRVAIPNAGGTSAGSGNCATVNSGCAGPVVGDMDFAITHGARVYATPWSPPALYKTNGNTSCNASPGNGGLNYALLSTTVAPSNVTGNSWLYTFSSSNSTAASNAWSGLTLNFSGYTGGATGNNGSFIVTASTSTSVTVTNATGTIVNTGSSMAVNFYTPYAAWLANFVQSLAGLSPAISLYAISVQNEPDNCPSYDGAEWNRVTIQTFVTTYLGPTFTSDSISTLIFMPETSRYANLSGNNGGSACGTATTCTNHLGGYNWHDYDAALTGTNTVAADPVPAGWTTGLKWWETEASCYGGSTLPLCTATGAQSGFVGSIQDALNWAAVIDQRLAGDNANAWLYWYLKGTSNTDNQGLTSLSGIVAQRAFMLAQYAKFIRPGYYRIDATRNPVSTVSVSAYQNTPTGAIVIVATNYDSSAHSVTFNVTNAPVFPSLTPTITSASQSLASLSPVSLSGNSFTYNLPAQSIVTFTSNTLPANSFSNGSFSGMTKQ